MVKVTIRPKKIEIFRHEVLERLMEPENREISLRYILKNSTRGGSNIFQLFDTSEKQDHFVASRRRWLETAREWAKRVA